MDGLFKCNIDSIFSSRTNERTKVLTEKKQLLCESATAKVDKLISALKATDMSENTDLVWKDFIGVVCQEHSKILPETNEHNEKCKVQQHLAMALAKSGISSLKYVKNLYIGTKIIYWQLQSKDILSNHLGKYKGQYWLT